MLPVPSTNSMGVNINYTKRSAHLNHGLAKHKLEERREKQKLAQHRMEEAVRRAVRSTAAAAFNERHSTATSINGKRWAFSHARREGDRRMGAAVAHRSALTTSAYAVIPPEKLEKKKHQLLATGDWASISRSSSATIRSHSLTLVQGKIKPDNTKVKTETRSSAHCPAVVSKPKSVPELLIEPRPQVKTEVKIEDRCQYETSSIDMNMPSSPPQQDMTLSSSIQSNFSSSVSITPKRQADVRPSSQTLSAILSTQHSIATQATGSEVFVKAEIKEEKAIEPFQEWTTAPKAGLQYLGPPFTYLTHIRDLDMKPLACSFLLPCMVGNENSPFVYDGMTRSTDYLGMSFAGPDMED